MKLPTAPRDHTSVVEGMCI